MNTQPSTVQDAEQNPSLTSKNVAAKEVAVKMKDVCKALGWKVEAPSDEFSHVYLKAQVEGFPSSYASLTYGRYPCEGRITVTAYSKYDSAIYRYGEKHLSISVCASRPAEAILKEVQRRFVPSYLEIARKAEEIQHRHEEYSRKLEACMGNLKGEPLDEPEKQNGKVRFHLDDIWGAVQYASDDQLAIEFHNVPAEKVGRILGILREKVASPQGESIVSDSDRGSRHE